MKKMKSFVAEVSYPGRIDEYDVVASDALQGRGLIIRYLARKKRPSIRIRLRSIPRKADGKARVIGKSRL